MRDRTIEIMTIQAAWERFKEDIEKDMSRDREREREREYIEPDR